MNWPTGLFLTAALISIVSDKLGFYDQHRPRHIIGAFCAMLVIASMAVSLVRFYHRPDPSLAGTIAGFVFMAIFTGLFVFSLGANIYKLATGKDRLGFWNL